MSKLLNCDFFSDEEAVSTPEADSAVPEEKPVRSANRRSALLIACAAAAVILAVCLLVIPRLSKKAQPVYTDANGVSTTPADYQAITPNDQDKAYISIEPSLTIENMDGANFYLYTFLLHEDNGTAFSIERVQNVMFWQDSAGADEYSAGQIRKFNLASLICPHTAPLNIWAVSPPARPRESRTASASVSR